MKMYGEHKFPEVVGNTIAGRSGKDSGSRVGSGNRELKSLRAPLAGQPPAF